jgi:hypothetical protein
VLWLLLAPVLADCVPHIACAVLDWRITRLISPARLARGAAPTSPGLHHLKRPNQSEQHCHSAQADAHAE